jgi:transcriptional regulator with XRE-family HTH domain
MVDYKTGFRQKRTVRWKAAMNELDIPNLIKELRERLGLTQEQFAQRVGVTFSSVNHWENGKRTPQPFLVRRLVEMKEELDAEQKRSPKRKSSE